MRARTGRVEGRVKGQVKGSDGAPLSCRAGEKRCPRFDFAPRRSIGVHDNRRLKRWHLIYYLRVFEQGSMDLFGHVVDITTQGMRLVNTEPITPGLLFTFAETNAMDPIIGNHSQVAGPSLLWARQCAMT